MAETFVDTTWLVSKSACDAQIALFEKEWPAGVLVTEANLRRANEIGINLHWFARVIFTDPKAMGEFQAAIKPYMDTRDASMNLAKASYLTAKATDPTKTEEAAVAMLASVQADAGVADAAVAESVISLGVKYLLWDGK